MAISEILVTGARVLYAPFGTARPDETAVAYGASWSNWTDLGFTSSPLNISYTDSEFDVDVQQSAAPAASFRISEQLMATTRLAEFSTAVLAILLGGQNTPVSAGAGQKAYHAYGSGGQTVVPYYAFGFEGFRLDSLGNKQPLRVFFLRAQMKLSGSLVMAKNQELGIPIRIKAFIDPNETAVGLQTMRIDYVTAPATS